MKEDGLHQKLLLRLHGRPFAVESFTHPCKLFSEHVSCWRDYHSDIATKITILCWRWKILAQFNSVYFCIPTKHRILGQQYRDRKRRP